MKVQRKVNGFCWAAAAGALLLAGLSTGCHAAQAPATNGAAAQTPAQNSGGALAGIKTIDNPSGGRIYLGALAGQPTAADAMGKVMQRVTSLCGDRPQLGKLDKNSTGEILAGFFTVTGKSLDGKPMKGLAIVYAPKTGTAGGAVLLDDADRFQTTLNPMFTMLKQTLGVQGGSSGAQASAGGTGNSAQAGAPAVAAAPVKAGPAPPLQRAVFPDGTGSIGLPAGWQMQNAQQGDVNASGPQGEKLRFGWTIAVLDPTNPGSRALMGNGRVPPNFVAIPLSADPATAFKAAFTQLAQKARKQPPVIDIAKVQDIPMQGGANEFMLGDIDFNDGKGKQFLVAQMLRSQVIAVGSWQMKLFVIYGPQQVISQEASTIAEIYPNYSLNTQMVNAIANQQIQQSIAITNQAMNTAAQYMDSTDRMTAGMSNLLRDQSVVVDTQTGGHATTSDDLAGALVNANPGRFQTVSPSGYIPGIDY